MNSLKFCPKVVQSTSKLAALMQIRCSGTSYAKKRLKNYELPKIKAEDCEQKYISGWGPGGSKVNSSKNAVMLRHKDTNCIVKVHDSRTLRENIEIAFKRLQLAVDRHINGDNCYEKQFERYQKEYEANSRRVKDRRRQIFDEIKNDNENNC